MSFFFFKQKTAYEMRISDWGSDVCSSDRVADLGGRARTIDAVDEHADRRLDAGIVRAVAEAADDEIGVGARLELADAQAGHRRLQVDQIANRRIFKVRGRGYRHRDGRILQRLRALRGGDDDLAAIDRKSTRLNSSH